MKQIRIFLSSPGDCEPERNIVKEVVAQINQSALAQRQGLQLHVEAWEDGAPLGANGTPQENVDQSMGRPQDFEIFLGIMKVRLGTPLDPATHPRPGGGQYLSGSCYEFEMAILHSASNQGEQPRCFLFRGPKGAGKEAEKVDAFFHSPLFQLDTGELIRSVNPYDDLKHFGQKVTQLLEQYLLEFNSFFPERSLWGWAQEQRERLIEKAQARYTPAANVRTELAQELDWFLRRQSSLEELDAHLEKVDSSLRKIRQEIGLHHHFRKICQHMAQWEFTTGEFPVTEVHSRLEKFYTKIQKLFFFLIESKDKDYNERAFESLPGSRLSKSITGEISSKRNQKTSYDRKKIRELRNSRKGHQLMVEVGKMWRPLIDASHEAKSNLEKVLRRLPQLANQVLLITGEAGKGKTHTLVDLVSEQIAQGGVAFGALGHDFTGLEDIGEQFLRILQAKDFNFTAFLERLEQEAKERKTFSLLVIDALNEAPHRELWNNQIFPFLEQIKKYPSIRLILSIRDVFIPSRLPPLDQTKPRPWREVRHPGFSGVETQALEKYFSHFGITGGLPAVVGEFANPLFLKYFCRSIQLRGESKIPSPIPSWGDIRRDLFSLLDHKALKDRNLIPDETAKQPLQKAIKLICSKMIKRGQLKVLKSELKQDLHENNRLVGFLLQEAILRDDPTDDESDEWLSFAYQRLSDSLLAEELLKFHCQKETIEESINALREQLKPGSWIYQNLLTKSNTWDAEVGIIEMLFLEVPHLFQVELFPLLEQMDEKLAKDHARIYWESLKWRNQGSGLFLTSEEIKKFYRKYAKSIFHSSSNQLDEIFHVSIIPRHPLSADHLLHPYLKRFATSGKRDAAFQPDLYRIWVEEQSSLHQLLRWALKSHSFGEVNEEQARLGLTLLTWCCSSPNLNLRREAEKGLAKLLVASPKNASWLMDEFFGVEDDYIHESILLALWALIIINPKSAKPIATKVYQQYLSQEGHIPLNILIRHRARKIVEDGKIGLSDPTSIHPPYHSNLQQTKVPRLPKWQNSSKAQCRVLHSLENMGDFFRYTMKGDMGGYFSANPLQGTGAKRNPWRKKMRFGGKHPNCYNLPLACRWIYQFVEEQWSLDEATERYDSSESRQSWRTGGTEGNERIGKKYTRIGLARFYGYLTDHYKLRQIYSFEKDLEAYKAPDDLGYKKDNPLGLLEEPAKDEWASYPNPFSLDLPWPKLDMACGGRWLDDERKSPNFHKMLQHPPQGAPLPKVGQWMRLMPEHKWDRPKQIADWLVGKPIIGIWRMATPLLVQSQDLSSLHALLTVPASWRRLLGVNHYDIPRGDEPLLSKWPDQVMDKKQTLECSFKEGKLDFPEIRDLAIEHRHLICIADAWNEGTSPILPIPWLWKEFQLNLNFDQGIWTLPGGEPLFYNPRFCGGENRMFVEKVALQKALRKEGWELIWVERGEDEFGINWDHADKYFRRKQSIAIYHWKDGLAEKLWAVPDMEKEYTDK